MLYEATLSNKFRKIVGIEISPRKYEFEQKVIECLKLYYGSEKEIYPILKNCDMLEFLNDASLNIKCGYLNLGENSLSRIQESHSDTWNYIDKILEKCQKDFKLVCILPEHDFRRNPESSNIIKKLLDNRVIEKIISLPRRSIAYSNASLVILSNEKKDEVKYIDLSSIYIDEVDNLYEQLSNDSLSTYIDYETLSNELSISPSYIYAKKQLSQEDNCKLLDSISLNIYSSLPSYRLMNNKVEDGEDGITIRTINSSYINHNFYLVDDIEDIKVKEIDRKLKESELRKGDILISNKSTTFKFFVYDYELGPIYPIGVMMIIRPDLDVIDPYYLAAYLASNNGQKKLEMSKRVGSVWLLNLDTLAQLSIPVPDIDLQKKIGERYRIISNKLQSIEMMKRRYLNNLLELSTEEESKIDRIVIK